MYSENAVCRGNDIVWWTENEDAEEALDDEMKRVAIMVQRLWERERELNPIYRGREQATSGDKLTIEGVGY